MPQGNHINSLHSRLELAGVTNFQFQLMLVFEDPASDPLQPAKKLFWQSPSITTCKASRGSSGPLWGSLWCAWQALEAWEGLE